MQSKTILSWDLGATKCAAGIVQYHNEKEYDCIKHCRANLKDCDSLDDLVNKIDDALDFDSASADAICIGGAGQFNGQDLILTNGYPYKMDFARLHRHRHWPKFTVIHDYSSVACATFTSYMNDQENIRILQEGQFDPYGRRVTFGVGTGLGLKDSILFPNGDFWLGTNEVGHIGISHPPLCDSAHAKRHEELIHFLRTTGVLNQNEPLTFEKILSGKGAVRLYQFVHGEHQHCTPEVVGERLREGEAQECLEIFAWYLGLFISNIQLIFMPTGGIWITGGVILKNLALFDLAEFWNGIAASPSYAQERTRFPLGVLRNPEHALVGCAFYAVNRLLSPIL